MNGIIEFAVRRWQFSLLAFAMLVALGLNAFFAVPRTEDPQLSFPNYFVTAVLPGATPADMEQQVTKPIEDALAGLDNLREVRSTTGDGVVAVTAEYVWGTEPERKYDEIVREINALRPSLPAGVARLEIQRARPTGVPIVQVALVSRILPMRALDKQARDLRDAFARVPGIRKAEVFGAPVSELRVALDTARLAAMGIPAGAVIDALRAAGADTPIGSVNAGARRFNVRYAGTYPDLAAVRAVPVGISGGRSVLVGDVAAVDWAQREASHIVRFNGERALVVTAEQADHQDVRMLTDLLRTEIDRFRLTLPGSVRLETGFVQAENVRRRLGSLGRDFLLAFAIVAFTLLPLGWRAAGVVMLAIPVSLLIGMSLLATTGFGLNQMAVTGFVISLGLLVDDAIVVIENVARWLRGGADPMTAAIGATQQIALAVLGCTACLMFAFLPLVALPEAAGEFIRSLPVAVLGTVLGSLLVSLTLIPFAASRFLSRNEDPHGNGLLRLMTGGIERVYAPVLRCALARPWRALAIILGIAMLSVPLLSAIGSSLFPPAELPQFLIKIEMPKGTALATTDAMVRRIDARVRREPSVVWTVANAGRGSPRLYYNSVPAPEDPALGEVAVSFRTWDNHDSTRVQDRLRAEFDRIPGARIKIVNFVQGPPVEAPVAVRIVGPDLDTLTRLADRGEQVLRSMPQLRDVANPMRMARTDLQVEVDEARARALSVPAGAIRQAMQVALGGATPAVLRDADGDDYPVTVRLPMAGRNEVSALDRVYVSTPAGGSVPLSTLATLRLHSGAAQIERIQRERAVTLSAYVRDGVLVSRVTETALARLGRELVLPPGYSLKVAGEADAQQRSFGGLLPAVVVATVGILGVLVLEFGTFRNVIVIAGVVPLGFFGAVGALWLTGNSLSFTAAIGLIALVGIEIKNSILLVDFTEQLRRDGLPVREAVEKAGELRFLPVLLTSITAIGGLLPLAIEGNGLNAPMAIAMIGGLVTSTLLARIATPVMYLLLAERAEPRARFDHAVEGALA
ncbi:efflux RND transporter permease subunit [Novosphingobium sp. KCTC 2891]|uniref:efflux RND transporter permease subunit n=1 Tax=Novosphingobium sp. KCTC 2891 TaxID=2989730 RepID=UPI0022234FED|nr:efflux RND transporter permease subunit [Novosphingobium sp. KCTC 2891]MCW1383132.1 efflux RND transporter permease subunit [Novosphingobium sp. KCTC 2891]